MAPDPNLRELRSLVDAVCTETASEDSLDALGTLLQGNEAAQQFYLKYCRLHAELYLACRGQQAHKAVLEVIRSRKAPPPSSSPVVFLASAVHGTVGYFSSGWPLAYLVATVVMGVAVLIGSLVHVSQPEQVARQPALPSTFGRGAESTLPSPSGRGAGGEGSDNVTHRRPTVGRITGMVDCQWKNDECRMMNDELSAQNNGIHPSSFILHPSSPVSLGDKFALASGLMEITYDTGAKVILQGPVTYEVESVTGGYLSVGKLTAKLENKAKDPNPQSLIPNPSSLSTLHYPLFTIKTPTATVTDLGTEFGVEVSSEGATDTQVFVGKVQIAAAGGRRGGNGQTRVIRAGQYTHVGKEMALCVDERDFEVRAKQFTRAMPAGLPTSDAYAKLVLSMDPVVYYRMDQWPKTGKKGRYVLVDSAPGAHHGVACLDETFGKPERRGKFGGALDIHGSMANEFAFVKDYPKAENGQLSVSAWVWPVTLEPWVGIAGNWYHSPSHEEIGQFGFGVNDDLELSAQIHQQDGEVVRVCERGQPLPRSQWHYVAFVADGAVLRLYRNGVEVGAVPYRGIARPPLLACLSIGCAMDKEGARPRPENAFVWNGRLDEIAVFNHALSAEQVRLLYTGQATKMK